MAASIISDMHDRGRTVWIIIPAFNEGDVIGSVIAAVKDRFPNVVVVDDCSRDNTAEIAWSSGATVISHPLNLGQGAALQTGIDYALAQGAGYVVTFDADGQHDVADIAVMLEVAEESGFDVVLGSRFLGKESAGMPVGRRRILKAAVLFERITTGARVTDAHNGLRLISAAAATKLRIRCSRMAHASEILSGLTREHLRYVEVPVRVSYTQYSLTKGQKTSQAIAILKDLFVEWLSR